MARIPAFCPNCRTLFQSRLLRTSASANVTVVLKGNRESCPACGELAQTVDGVFNFSGDVIKLISGPRFTKDVLRRFSEVVDRAARQGTNVDQIEREVSKIDPELGQRVASISSSPNMTLAVLIFIVFIMKSCNFNMNVSVDLNRLWDQWVNSDQNHGVNIQSDTESDNRDLKATQPAYPSRQVRRREELLRKKRLRKRQIP